MAETNKGHGINIPIILLGVVVVAVFGTAIFSYQVNETERAVVLTFNKITGEKGPGLHFRWPLPIQKIQKYDSGHAYRIYAWIAQQGMAVERNNGNDHKWRNICS